MSSSAAFKVDRTLVVVPAFNESATLGDVLQELGKTRYPILVVDDGSTDGTSTIAACYSATVLRLPLNLGVGGALRTGFRYAVDYGFNAVVQVDADGQHPVAQIGDLLKHAETVGAHLVIGSRYLSRETTIQSSRFRRWAMRLLGSIVSRSAGKPITDSTSGFRVICEPLLTEFAREFPNYYLGDTFEATLAATRAGYSVSEVPAALKHRAIGVSSASNGEAFLMVAKVLISSLCHLSFRVAPLGSPKHQ